MKAKLTVTRGGYSELAGVPLDVEFEVRDVTGGGVYKIRSEDLVASVEGEKARADTERSLEGMSLVNFYDDELVFVD